MSQEQVVSEKKFRPEIEGLRAVAALLVRIYHIWLGKVSGGVEVCFVCALSKIVVYSDKGHMTRRFVKILPSY
ncbi:hypothetical protein ACFPVV_04525 [Macrococcoides bohemicum]|uniref:Acyltransferase n=1 Tax=Macrococcoides bohemicum TaxID=1903056 RepID=A0A328A6C6_9STAP|nr:hypothetical protein [Macrococcus bohemicus]RAK49404.1 hypothetical protein BHX94_06220 [Macrococcus bohemicus]